MPYQEIVDPKNGQKVSINSKEGKEIIKYVVQHGEMLFNRKTLLEQKEKPRTN